jgi:hypothetical protein
MVLPPPENLRTPPALKSTSSPQSIRDLLEPPTAQARATSVDVKAPPGCTDERKCPVVSPLRRLAISHSEGPAQALLPTTQTSPRLESSKSPGKHQTLSLPSIQYALAKISGPYNLPPVPTSLPSIEAAWDHELSEGFIPSPGAPSPYPCLFPASSSGIPTMFSSASQGHPQCRHTQSNISCLAASNYNSLPSAIKGPATSYPTATDQTPTAEQPLLNSGLQPIAPVSTGTFKCQHLGCTATPFRSQRLLK